MRVSRKTTKQQVISYDEQSPKSSLSSLSSFRTLLGAKSTDLEVDAVRKRGPHTRRFRDVSTDENANSFNRRAAPDRCCRKAASNAELMSPSSLSSARELNRNCRYRTRRVTHWENCTLNVKSSQKSGSSECFEPAQAVDCQSARRRHGVRREASRDAAFNNDQFRAEVTPRRRCRQRKSPVPRSTPSTAASAAAESDAPGSVLSPPVLRVFNGPNSQSEYSRWLERAIESMVCSFEVPTLVSRKRECRVIHETVDAAFSQGDFAPLYISGCPGTGKSAAVRQVISEYGLSAQRAVWINCGGVSSREFIRQLGAAIGVGSGARQRGRAASSRLATTAEAVEAAFAARVAGGRGRPAFPREPLVLVLDEVDLLAESAEAAPEFLQALLNACGDPRQRICLICISNALTLGVAAGGGAGCDETRTAGVAGDGVGRIGDRFPRPTSDGAASATGAAGAASGAPPRLRTLPFSAYTAETLLAVVRARLPPAAGGGPSPFAESLELPLLYLARRVSRSSGDCRKMLDATRGLLQRLLLDEGAGASPPADPSPPAAANVTPEKTAPPAPPAPAAARAASRVRGREQRAAAGACVTPKPKRAAPAREGGLATVSGASTASTAASEGGWEEPQAAPAAARPLAAQAVPPSALAIAQSLITDASSVLRAVASLPRHQQVLLCAICRAAAGGRKLSGGAVAAAYADCCSLYHLPPGYGPVELLREGLSALGSAGFVHVRRGRGGIAVELRFTPAELREVLAAAHSVFAGAAAAE